MARKDRIIKLLREMKDMSVLSIDLAYGSVLFGSREIAKEVIDINAEMGELRDRLENAVLKKAKTEKKAVNLRGILRLGAYADRISDIASDMAKKVVEGNIHEVEKNALKEAEERFVKTEVPKDFNKRNVSEFGDIHNLFIIGLKRRKEWIYHPKCGVKLKTGDIILGTKL